MDVIRYRMRTVRRASARSSAFQLRPNHEKLETIRILPTLFHSAEVRASAGDFLKNEGLDGAAARRLS